MLIVETIRKVRQADFRDGKAIREICREFNLARNTVRNIIIIVSAPKNVITPVEDCLIALTTFELYAQTLGIGTVWDGLAKFVISELLPEFKSRLGIPEDHAIGYAMAFGKPAVSYSRTVQHEPAGIHFVN